LDATDTILNERKSSFDQWPTFLEQFRRISILFFCGFTYLIKNFFCDDAFEHFLKLALLIPGKQTEKTFLEWVYHVYVEIVFLDVNFGENFFSETLNHLFLIKSKQKFL